MPELMTAMRKPIPGPPSPSWLGHLRDAQARPLELALEVTREYGDVVQLRLGPTRLIIVNHPDHVKRVLQDNHANYGRPAFVPLLRRLVGNGLLFSEGEFWLRQRRTMQPMFHRERIASFAAVMGVAVARRVARWRECSQTEPLDMSHELAELSFEIVGRSLFSTDLVRDASALADAIRFTLAWLGKRTQRPIAAPLFVPTAENRQFRAAQALFAGKIAELIAERRKGAAADDPGDLLSMLMAARDADTGEGMSDSQLQAEILTFLIAGYETTSSALEWTLLLLAQHPEIARGVRDEQRRVCGDRPPGSAEVSGMLYTRAVIDEALRLYPPVFGLARRVIADDEIAGYRIPRGAQLLVSTYALHRHPGFWPNPDQFDPSRFRTEAAAKRPRYAYFPFGGGPRQCIGNAFAMLELQVLVPTLIGALDLSVGERASAAPLAGMTLRPEGPLLMHVRDAQGRLG